MHETEQDKLRREAVLGAVDEDGDAIWFVSPSSMRRAKRDGGDPGKAPEPDPSPARPDGDG